MNFGIMGFGRIAHKFVNSIIAAEGGQVTAVASHSLPTDDPWLIVNPQVKLYRDYGELLNDPDIQAVYIALPHGSHAQWCIKALHAGKAVLCEKPLSIAPQEVERIMAAAEETGQPCLEAMKTRFNEGYAHLQEDVTSLGGAKYISCGFCGDSLSWLERYHVDGHYLLQPGQGGALNDVATYPLSFILGLVDASITTIDAAMEYAHGVDRYFKATLTFADGAQAVAEGAMDRNGSRTAFIRCPGGEIEVPWFNRLTEYTIRHLGGKEERREFPFVGDDMTEQIRALIRWATEGNPPVYTLQDSLLIAQVTERIRQAARS